MMEFGSAVIAAGVLVGLAALIVLHVLPTGLSPLHRAVSQYGLGRYRAGDRVQTVAYGVAGIGADAALQAALGILSAAMILAMIALGVARRAGAYFGLVERTSSSAITLWLSAVAALGIRSCVRAAERRGPSAH